jgi:hypothetical protein
LEGCQSRLRTRLVAWEGDRDRLLTDVKVRQETADRQLAAVTNLRERWEKSRRHELSRLRAGLAAAHQLHEQYAALRDEWFRRNELLEAKERSLADKALALEQYRQECLGKADDAPAAEQRLTHLRRRWTTLHQAAEKKFHRDRQAFRAEMAQFEARNQQVEKLARELAAQEAKLTGQQVLWEQEKLQAQTRLDQMARNLQSLQSQRHADERQLADLRGEVEHVARLLMEENELPMVPVLVQAA